MSGPYKIQITSDFLNQLHSFDPKIFLKWRKIGRQFLSDPFHRSLQTEQINGAEDGIHSARLDDNYRLIFKLVKPKTIILGWVNTHDKAYAKARRMSISLHGENVRLVETVEDSKLPKHLTWKEQGPELLFHSHTDQTLLSTGIPSELLPQIRTLTEVNDLQSFEKKLSPDVWAKLLNLVWPDIHKQPEDTDKVIREPIENDRNQSELALIDTSEEFERVLEGSIQEWMLFLHPSQRQIVEATYSGPARIKGVAGSGKTVVALHRTRLLAKTAPRGQKVLFLTFSNRLAGVADELISLLCGNGAERASIEVRTLHSWCKRFVGDRTRICSNDNDRRALSKASRSVLSTRPQLRVRYFTEDFVPEEIRTVVQGRALGDREAYLGLKRVGRGTPLSDDDRQTIFLIYEEYKRLLRPEIDFNELVLQSLQKIRNEGIGSPYYGIVVDEIQDLTESAMRLIKEIASANLHNLLLIGDGQQQIYQAGFSLREAGIEIVGRSRILRQNYRNTKPILEAAYSMIKDMEFDDLGDEGAPTRYPPEYTSRGGKKPVLRRCSSEGDEQKWLEVELRQLLNSDPKLFVGDVAILARTNRKLTAVHNSLRTLGFSTCFLSKANVKEYFNKGTLKLVTIHSAKGLEFKVVFIVGMSTSQNNGDMSEDALEREQRLLYVAMTRARDMLYISYCGEPSKFVRQIAPHLLDARR